MLETEITEELGYERYDQTEGKTNYRNGHKGKRVKTTMGEMEIEIPQDRNSEFAPKIVPIGIYAVTQARHKRNRAENHQYVRTRTYDARDKRANRRHLWIWGVSGIDQPSNGQNPTAGRGMAKSDIKWNLSDSIHRRNHLQRTEREDGKKGGSICGDGNKQRGAKRRIVDRTWRCREFKILVLWLIDIICTAKSDD